IRSIEVGSNKRYPTTGTTTRIWSLRLWTRDKLEKTPSYPPLTMYKVTIPHNLCNLVVTELDSTEKLVNEIGELRAISSHVLGASGVQIPQNNLDNLRSTEEEEDGATEVLDPRDVPGSVLLEITDFAILGIKASDNAGQARQEKEPVKDYILLPLWTADPQFSQDPKSSHDDGSKPSNDDGKKVDEDPRKDINAIGEKPSIELPDDPNMPTLEDYSIFDFTRNDEDYGVVADMKNLDTTIQVSPIPTTRSNKDHPLDQIEAMQEELLQFKLQKVWTLVDLPNGKSPIGTKWVFRNKKDERGIVIRNKARLVAQGYTQEEGIEYDEVFAHVARIEAIRQFLAYASFKDFVVLKKALYDYIKLPYERDTKSSKSLHIFLCEKDFLVICWEQAWIRSLQTGGCQFLEVINIHGSAEIDSGCIFYKQKLINTAGLLTTAGRKLMLLGINLLLLLKFNAARHKLTTDVEILELENTKTSQAAEIAKLKEKVKKLERRSKSRTLGLKRLKKVGRTARIESSEDEEITLVNEAQERNNDNLMFDTRVFDEQEVEVEKVVSTAEVTTAISTTTTDNTQAMMEADYELAQRLQAEEQGELTIEERSKLFVELMDKRKKHFAKLRAEDIRRKSPTKA
ncbi:putative ribonuclease H-like domain-containing protein, partial [Tanacetum coccineum]